MEKGGTVINAGPIDIAMSYRAEIMDDQGLCLQVYSEIDGHDTEILRFDCFDQAPHYHYGPENHNIRLHLDKTTAGNPLGWTIGNLRNNLTAMVRRSGYDDLADTLEANPVSSEKLDEIESTAREMSLGGRRTVHHMMPEMLDGDKITVGNLKFGLEYRHLPQINDEGMAIHVCPTSPGRKSSCWPSTASRTARTTTTAPATRTSGFTGTSPLPARPWPGLWTSSSRARSRA